MNAELIAWGEAADKITVPPFGYQVFYKELGDSSASAEQTLLLIHGFPESSFSFHKVVDGLLGHFKRVVLLDMLGYGFSDKPESDYSYSLVPQADVVLAVWQHLGIKGGHILSHDMGTSVLTEIVARHVNQQLPAWFNLGIQSLTFTNGSMALEFANLRLMQKLLLNKKIGPVISRAARYSLFRKTIMSANGAPIDESDIESLWQNCLMQDGHKKNHHIIRYLNDRKRYEKTRWLPALAIASNTVPTHICWGTADNVASVAMAQYLKEDICPNATLTLMPNVGHFCQITSPELWLKSVLEFYYNKVIPQHNYAEVSRCQTRISVLINSDVICR